jgi:hypothetical protein
MSLRIFYSENTEKDHTFFPCFFLVANQLGGFKRMLCEREHPESIVF